MTASGVNDIIMGECVTDKGHNSHNTKFQYMEATNYDIRTNYFFIIGEVILV